MACMTHTCAGCGIDMFDNNPSQDCPKCGELMVSSIDEDPYYIGEYDKAEDIDPDEVWEEVEDLLA